MRGPTLRIVILLCLVGGTAAGLLLQHQASTRLLVDRDALRSAQRELARLQGENRRLAAAQVPPEELARMRDEHASLERLRGEIATLQRRPADPAPTAPRPEPQTATKGKAKTEPPLAGPRIPASEWKFAGTSNPTATFQSLVWAATHGETDQLAPLLTFDPPDRKQLETTFAGLSDDTRVQYGSPEKFAAALLAVQVPQDLTAIGVVADLPTTPGEVAVVMRLERGRGDLSKDATFIFRQENAGWRLVVPTEVVAGFVRALTQPAKRPGQTPTPSTAGS